MSAKSKKKTRRRLKCSFGCVPTCLYTWAKIKWLPPKGFLHTNKEDEKNNNTSKPTVLFIFRTAYTIYLGNEMGKCEICWQQMGSRDNKCATNPVISSVRRARSAQGHKHLLMLMQWPTPLHSGLWLGVHLCVMVQFFIAHAIVHTRHPVQVTFLGLTCVPVEALLLLTQWKPCSANRIQSESTACGWGLLSLHMGVPFLCVRTHQCQGPCGATFM